MKKLLSFLGITAEMVIGLYIISFLLCGVYCGLNFLIENIPDYLVIGSIGIVGFILGAIKFFTDEKLDKKYNQKDHLED